ncbi:hypothetical protein Pan54_13950 [Rubinisphaera italica]|uniref:Uncharacterized protein n=1 Tax=Rubinisphaera italica TaxID=2527969 RepID=A0A5C5XE57_9PLAN|nr:hypothetical protein Pan54_13950 [Rubinisphaera italica]
MLKCRSSRQPEKPSPTLAFNSINGFIQSLGQFADREDFRKSALFAYRADMSENLEPFDPVFSVPPQMNEVKEK